MQHSFFLHESAASPGVESAILSIRTPGVVNAALADFELASFVSEGWTLNTSALATLNIGIGSYGEVTEDYDFCMRDIVFLDAAGNAVNPRE